MPNTSNLELVVTDDSTVLFKDWRMNINGTDGSNMNKIDDFAGKFVGGAANQYYKKKSTKKFDGGWETPDSSPAKNSNKLITSAGVYSAIGSLKTETNDNISNAIAIVDNGSKIVLDVTGDVLQELSPDVFYQFTGVLTSLNITLGEAVAGRENEYKGQFLTSSTPPLVTFPADIVWVGGFHSIEANKYYQFSILNGIGVLVGV